MKLKTVKFIEKIQRLLKTLTLPYQIGFVQGHYYLTNNEILQIKRFLDSDNNAEIISEYEQRMTSLIGSGYGMSFAVSSRVFY